jgi:hypothetical protein
MGKVVGRLLITIALSLFHIFISYYLLWYIAGTFDLEFIQQPTWRQYFGFNLIFSLFTFPFVYDKAKKQLDGDSWNKYLTNQSTLLFGSVFIYLFALLLNWVLG